MSNPTTSMSNPTLALADQIREVGNEIEAMSMARIPVDSITIQRIRCVLADKVEALEMVIRAAEEARYGAKFASEALRAALDALPTEAGDKR